MKPKTKTKRRPEKVPFTVTEKYEYLKNKNSNLEILQKHFDLKLNL